MRLGLPMGYGVSNSPPHVSGPDRLFVLTLALSAGRPVFTADYFIIDSNTGKILALVDWNDPTHLLIQNTGATQSTIISHADFANKFCMSFTGVEWYQSNRAAATWNSQHTGNSGVFGIVTVTNLATNRRLVGTRTAVANRGFSIQYQTNQDIIFSVLGASTTQFSTGQSAPINTPVQFSANYLEGGNLGPGEYVVRVSGWPEAGGNSVSPPDTGDATESERLGGRGTTPDLLFVGRLPVIIHTPALISPERAIVRRYLQYTYGVAP